MTAPDTAAPAKCDMRPLRKTVSVTVDVEVSFHDLASTLTRSEVLTLCERHRIEIKRNSGRGGNRYKISKDDLANVADAIRRGHVDDALIRLERLLPREFHHLSEDVAAYYRGRR